MKQLENCPCFESNASLINSSTLATKSEFNHNYLPTRNDQVKHVRSELNTKSSNLHQLGEGPNDVFFFQKSNLKIN